MPFDELNNLLGEELKDIKLNLMTLLNDDLDLSLTPSQRYLIALACSYASRNDTLTKLIRHQAESHLTPKQLAAANSAAAIMAMNNIYYRFIHLVNDETFASLPPKLRMNTMTSHGIDPIDFELACVAVSAINGCGRCMDSHTKHLLKLETNKLAIQTAIRITAVIHAAAVGLG